MTNINVMTAFRTRLQLLALIYLFFVVGSSLFELYFHISTVNTTHAQQEQQQMNDSADFSSRDNSSRIDTVSILLGSGNGPGSNPIFFKPSKLLIHAGDTVKWMNQDTVPHTATSVHFNTGLIWPDGSKMGSSEHSIRFDKSGTFAYFCQIHPHMSGVIFVDTEQTERVISTQGQGKQLVDVKIEMPRNTAYINENNGPFFIPAYSFVPIGTNVTWTNQDYVAHTATSAEGSFDTEAILPGQSKTIKLNHNPGTISYYCEIHPWMQATIEVTPTSKFLGKG
ncbi:MAG TPA: plastocyanin/azurin family copper-binding protein [Nitrososphaeraceae archaeon]|nr:plastocyanin/azurin family copper-binding protein [Nitrososphaeraceae archaeon]